MDLISINLFLEINREYIQIFGGEKRNVKKIKIGKMPNIRISSKNILLEAEIILFATCTARCDLRSRKFSRLFFSHWWNLEIGRLIRENGRSRFIRSAICVGPYECLNLWSMGVRGFHVLHFSPFFLLIKKYLFFKNENQIDFFNVLYVYSKLYIK